MVVPILQEAEEFGLNAQAERLDFVEQDSPPLRLRNQPGLVGPGTGKGPLRMPEQLALEQLLWDSPAVDRQKRFPCPATEIVQRSCTQLFTRPSFTGKEHGASERATRGSFRFSPRKA